MNIFKTNSTTRVAVLVLIGAFILVCGIFLCNKAQGQKTINQLDPKVYFNRPVGKCITLDSATWILRINQLSYVAQKLRQSDLPSKEVALITDSVLTAFQIELYQQVIKK